LQGFPESIEIGVCDMQVRRDSQRIAANSDVDRMLSKAGDQIIGQAVLSRQSQDVRCTPFGRQRLEAHFGADFFDCWTDMEALFAGLGFAAASRSFDSALDLKCTSRSSLPSTRRRFAMTDVREICNLSDEDFEARGAELAGGLARRVRERRNLGSGVALAFDATPEMREELNAFIDFERGCCPTLEFSISEASGALQLEIRGIEPDSGLFAGVGLVAASGRVSPSRDWRRILSSAGLGTLGALAVCCALPIALVAILGTAVAAPFTSLDNPWLISLSALAFACGIWLWQRRRDDARATANSGAGCGCS
jgi:hypothetical protein